MKLTSVSAIVAKVFTVGLLAAAVVMAAPTKAEAQVAVGVRIGHGPYFAPAYRRPYVVEPAPVVGFYGPAFYGPRYGNGWGRREEFFRHDDRRFYHR